MAALCFKMAALRNKMDEIEDFICACLGITRQTSLSECLVEGDKSIKTKDGIRFKWPMNDNNGDQ